MTKRLPTQADETIPDIQDVIASMGGEVVEINDYRERRVAMDAAKIRGRMTELAQERVGLIALRAELESQIAESEQRRSLALFRIYGINAAIEELGRLVGDEEPAEGGG